MKLHTLSRFQDRRDHPSNRLDAEMQRRHGIYEKDGTQMMLGELAKLVRNANRGWIVRAGIGILPRLAATGVAPEQFGIDRQQDFRCHYAALAASPKIIVNYPRCRLRDTGHFLDISKRRFAHRPRGAEMH